RRRPGAGGPRAGLFLRRVGAGGSDAADGLGSRRHGRPGPGDPPPRLRQPPTAKAPGLPQAPALDLGDLRPRAARKPRRTPRLPGSVAKAVGVSPGPACRARCRLRRNREEKMASEAKTYEGSCTAARSA